MKRIISTVLLLFAIATLSISAAALTAYDRQELSHVNALADQNPGFESGSVKWSGSPALTINSNAASQFVPGSKQFAVWDSNSASQEICSALVKVPESGNCAVSLTYKVPSGTATHKIVAKDGSKDLAVEDVFSSTAAWRHDVEFPCAAAASNQARVCLRSVASNEPAIQLDGGYAGQSRTVGQCGVDTPAVSFTPSGSWTNNTTYSGKWWRRGDRYHYEFQVALSGAPNSTSLTVARAPGLTIDTSKLVSTTTDGRKLEGKCKIRSAGVTYNGDIYYNGTSNTAVVVQNVASTYPFSSNVTQSLPGTFTNGDAIICEGSVPIVGWEASQCVTPEQQGWFAAGFISGGNPGLGSAAVSSYAEIANGSLSLTANTGSASVGIACSSTNASTVGSSTCSAGNEIIGITTNIPRTGVYEACFQFGHVINIGGSPGGSLTAAFQVVETANSSGTVTQEANGRVTSGAGYEGGSNSPNQVNPVMVCGTLSLNAGQRLIKVYYEQASPSGTIFTNEIQADASAAVGQRNIYFIVRPVNSQQQAILANSVTTKRQSGDRILSGTFNCDASSTVTRTNEPDSTSIGNIASGACAVTYAPFSAAPDACTPVIQTCSASSGTGCFARASTAATASGVSVQCYSDTGTLCTSHDFYMICTGPR